MATFRDANQTKAEIREVDTAEGRVSCAGEPGAVVLDVREPDEYEQGAIPGSLTSPGASSRATSRAGSPTRHAARGLLRRWRPLGVRRQDARQLGYTDVVSVAGGFNKWKDEGRDWKAPAVLTAEQRNRYQRHLLLPEVGDRRPAQAARRQGPAARRRRPRLARRAVPRGGRRGHDRHHRHGRRRRVEPAAPDPAQHGPHR